MKSGQRDAMQMARKEGLEVLSVEITGGTHYKLNVKNKSGDVAFFILGSTSSDIRALRKRESLFRRFAKGTFNPITKHGEKK
ncbi:hypothetical protein [Polynucleobacter sp. UK-Kesae-W10]|uniref:hypothetical protein n=1 Tax=Polynucleobacter sp. UK-Kesae-W10 TaxID=1819738 RepID=UPI001C0DE101|nr:hypothetical protein [Polynucleobacter sp. UK-Kesae-W10]MBU3577546.1 hypothetical protein [Polynucleobacter sp. UK-Kesae-W10]